MKLSVWAALALVVSASYAGGDFTQPVEQVIETPVQQTQDTSFFVYIAGGASFLDIDSALSPNATFTDGTLDDTGGVGELGVGYRCSKNIFATVAAQRTWLDIADIDNFYASINYQFSNVTAKPYIGAMVGYSQLTWSEDPHVVVSNKDLISDGMIYGIQAGLEHDLTATWTLFAKYQFIKYDHSMDIRSSSSTIEHNYGQNIVTGVRYAF